MQLSSELGKLEVEEDEEGAEDAAQRAEDEAGNEGEDVDVDAVLDGKHDVLLGGELSKSCEIFKSIKGCCMVLIGLDRGHLT